MSGTAGQKVSAALDEWNRTVRNIADEVQQRKGKKGLPPVDTSSGCLVRRAYDLIVRYIRSGEHNVFGLALAQASNLPRFRSSASQDPFRWGLAAIAAQDGIDLSEKEIPRLAARLHYAYSRNVPSEYVVGYLYQSGSSDHVAKLGRQALQASAGAGRQPRKNGSKRPKKRLPGTGKRTASVGNVATQPDRSPSPSGVERNRRKANVILTIDRKRKAHRRRGRLA